MAKNNNQKNVNKDVADENKQAAVATAEAVTQPGEPTAASAEATGTTDEQEPAAGGVTESQGENSEQPENPTVGGEQPTSHSSTEATPAAESAKPSESPASEDAGILHAPGVVPGTDEQPIPVGVGGSAPLPQQNAGFVDLNPNAKKHTPIISY